MQNVELEREHNVLQGILKGSGASNAGDAHKDVQLERDRLLRDINTLRMNGKSNAS